MGAPTTDRGGIQQTIRTLKAGGWDLDFVFDGGADIPVTGEQEAIDAIMSVDDAYLNVKVSSERYQGRVNETGWVRFVLGNEPYEVINDYTVNLSDAIDPMTDMWFESA